MITQSCHRQARYVHCTGQVSRVKVGHRRWVQSTIEDASTVNLDITSSRRAIDDLLLS